MSKTIVIRTHASSLHGIGHLTRTINLAISLKSFNIECYFVIDMKSSVIEAYLSEFKCKYLYSFDKSYSDELSDSKLFIGAVSELQINAVIVDDYRFSTIWEKSVKCLKVPVVVLDDRNLVDHDCSILLDAKWTGDTTNERYKNKTPKNCLRLLGPKFILLNQEYIKQKQIVCIKHNSNVINIMISIGGGGDMAIIINFLKIFLGRVKKKDVGFVIYVVVGPFALNKEVLLSIAKKDKRIQPIIGSKLLYKYIKKIDLYIGAAGGTLYEVLSMGGVPALTFSIEKNQYNEHKYLEDLGHYFHVNNINNKSLNKLSKLAWLMILNINRIKNLYSQQKKIYIDGLGANRLAQEIDILIKGEQSQYRNNDLLFSSFNPINKNNNTDGYIIESVNDKHVNQYLNARNLELNLQNMTETEKIDNLDHYIWWLTNNRKSYILKKSEKPLLYIWHFLRKVDEIDVLVGGWFVCDKSCSALDAVYALNWQINFTDKEFPNIPWVAVINKSNKFVHSLNKRLGFELIDEESVFFNITKACFPFATSDEFNFYIRKPI